MTNGAATVCLRLELFCCSQIYSTASPQDVITAARNKPTIVSLQAGARSGISQGSTTHSLRPAACFFQGDTSTPFGSVESTASGTWGRDKREYDTQCSTSQVFYKLDILTSADLCLLRAHSHFSSLFLHL